MVVLEVLKLCVVQAQMDTRGHGQSENPCTFWTQTQNVWHPPVGWDTLENSGVILLARALYSRVKE